MRKGMLFLGGLLAIGLIAAFVALWTARHRKNPQRLPGGSTLFLKEVRLVSTNYTYTHTNRAGIVGFLSPVLPDFILQKFSTPGGGGFGFAVEGTNLIVITVTKAAGGSASDIERLRIISEKTNVYDACWGAHTLVFMSETVHGWQVRSFPRRSRALTLQFLTRDPNGAWLEGASFEVPNPAFAEYPQWTPDAVPQLKTNDELVVELADFQSGPRMDIRKGNARTAPRATVLRLNFKETGQRSEQWRVQKLIISDATGNRWFPYLDLLKPEFNWAQQGRVEFMGALWPGEQAWHLDFEVVRSAGFDGKDLFEVELDLPPRRTVSTLTNQWEHEGVTLKLAGFASPETDFQGKFKWTAKWWGQDKEKVYSLAAELEPDRKGQRLALIDAVDEHGHVVEQLEHRAADSPQQAFFLKPADDSTKAKLKFALTPGRFVQFLARPQFSPE